MKSGKYTPAIRTMLPPCIPKTDPTSEPQLTNRTINKATLLDGFFDEKVETFISRDKAFKWSPCF
jgi:hypothetical protein